MKVSLPFRDSEGKSDSGRLPLWNSGEAGGLGLAFWLSRPQAGLIIGIMSPARLTPEKECYTVLVL
jgi:hypothetical protein